MTVKARPRGMPYFEQTVREFTDTLVRAKARTANLTGPTSNLEQSPDALREALVELRTHQEELAVANEELRAQLEELATATSRIHVERDRYQKLFDLTPDSYLVTDRLGTVRDMNGAASAMLGVEARFLFGKPLAVLVDAADSRALRDAIAKLRTERTVELELRFKRRNGTAVWHTLKGAVVPGDATIIWFGRGVQKEHDARVSLAVANEDARVAARSAHDDDLARANRDMEEILARERRLRAQLEREHVAKDRFLAVLSHDLRAPLNAVVGWTQLLRREHLDQAARDRALATIERNADAQIRLVDELLDMSRIAAGKVQLERVPVLLNELVQHAADAAATTARDRSIELTVSLGSEKLVVDGDRRRLGQVMSNLVSNALKFMSAGAGRVSLTVKRAGNDAHIIVADTGRGIAADLVPHLFDPFRQGADYATANEGVGLGLYIVERCVKMHGGRVIAESEGAGRGASFTVVLPLADGFSAREERASRPRDRDLGLGPNALEGVRVLVVDDEQDARDLMATILRHRGAVVNVAADVASAVHAFDAAPPDVVVSDIALPGRSGLDLARELRGQPRTGAAAALIAVSGFAGVDEVEGALAAGFDVHLAKPVDPAELVAVVRDAARARNV